MIFFKTNKVPERIFVKTLAGVKYDVYIENYRLQERFKVLFYAVRPMWQNFQTSRVLLILKLLVSCTSNNAFMITYTNTSSL